LEAKTGVTNYMQVANHLDDDNLMRFGDVHASNVKLNHRVPTFHKQDDSAPEPELLNYLYQADLKKLFSVSIYVWELVEKTEAWSQPNSRNVSA